MITKQQLSNLFTVKGKKTGMILHDYSIAANNLKLPVVIGIVNETDYQYEIDVNYIVDNEKYSIKDIQELVECGWELNEEKTKILYKL